MTPEFHRQQAQRYRRIASEGRDTDIAHLILLAHNHERAADILEELNKINTRLPRIAPMLNRTKATVH